jgi:site-specific DNA-methyltransferase (adenine-specific)
MKRIKCELYNDNYANFKAYNIPAKAQLVIADIPYNLGNMAYGSNPSWYVGGITRTVKANLQGNHSLELMKISKLQNFFIFVIGF